MIRCNDWLRLQEALFWQALRFRSRAQQRRFLAIHCQSSPTLMAAVQALLRCHQRQDGLLDHSLTSVENMLEQPNCRILRTRKAGYRLGSELGRGGMGAVFSATPLSRCNLPVAIKLARPRCISRASAISLITERNILSQLDHPFIVRYLDSGVIEDYRPFIVMEWIDGLPIDQFCDEHAVNLFGRIRLLMKVCRAVEYLHSQRLAHRDIKPGNVMVTHQKGQLVPKVLDFGISREQGRGGMHTSRRHAAKDLAIGTPSFMSPERFEDSSNQVESRCDVYSLGAMFYQLLCGSPPVTYEPCFSMSREQISRVSRFIRPLSLTVQMRSSASRRLAMLFGDQDAESLLASPIWKQLEDVVLRAIHKDPRQRCPRVDELRNALADWLANCDWRIEPRA